MAEIALNTTDQSTQYIRSSSHYYVSIQSFGGTVILKSNIMFRYEMDQLHTLFYWFFSLSVQAAWFVAFFWPRQGTERHFVCRMVKLRPPEVLCATHMIPRKASKRRSYDDESKPAVILGRSSTMITSDHFFVQVPFAGSWM